MYPGSQLHVAGASIEDQLLLDRMAPAPRPRELRESLHAPLLDKEHAQKFEHDVFEACASPKCAWVPAAPVEGGADIGIKVEVLVACYCAPRGAVKASDAKRERFQN